MTLLPPPQVEMIRRTSCYKNPLNECRIGLHHLSTMKAILDSVHKEKPSGSDKPTQI